MIKHSDVFNHCDTVMSDTVFREQVELKGFLISTFLVATHPPV